jgi:hypothetical protein
LLCAIEIYTRFFYVIENHDFLLCHWFDFVSLLFAITVRYMQNHHYSPQFDHTQRARGWHDTGLVRQAVFLAYKPVVADLL